jgi:alkylhydroperoxidase/carboxymuconolactone decarboxylase family protein YurZ
MQDFNFADIIAETIKTGVLSASLSDEHLVLTAAIRAVLDNAAAEFVGGANVSLVSMTLDVLNDAVAKDEVRFETELDRKTRTLVFINATATRGDTGVLKATSIYRILS